MELSGIVGVILGAVLGAGLGYYLRVREWMREKRLTGYVEFIASFFDVTRQALNTLAVSESGDDDDTFDEAYATFNHAWDRFAASRAQLIVLAGTDTFEAASACQRFVTSDLWPRDDVSAAEIERLQWKGLRLEHEFLIAASRELGPRLSRRKEHLLKGDG